jgi:hypothetical protein
MKKFRLALVLAVALSLRAAAAASISAELSADETSVGMPVQLEVRVEGSTNASLPSSLDIDGLQTQLTGRSTQVQIMNGRMSVSGVYSYTILPLREGTFDIPSLEVTEGGRKLRTSPRKLVVQAGAAPAPRPAPALQAQQQSGAQSQTADASNGRLAYAEMLVPKQSIYAGEVVPVELRFYFSGKVGFRPLQDGPQVGGEGFTVGKISPPKQTEENVGGATYRLLTFKTTITAVKSGEMALPVASLEGILSTPASGPAGLDDSIFGQMFGGFTNDQQVRIATDEKKAIKVRALPAEGRPDSFSGAVGEFAVSATADPTKAAPGDPVTLKVAVTGRGNFDAMGEPKLIDADGWRTYPATDHFEKSDPIGYGGTKTFEIPLVAQQPQTKTPVAQLSYFDPAKEKYFTLATQPVAVEAAAAAPTPTAAAPSAPQAQPSATPKVEEGGSWLVKSTPRSWQPLARKPAFWIANGAAALVLAGLAVALGIRRRREGPAGRRAAIVQQRDRLLSELGRGNLSDEAFLDKAHEALALQAGLAGESGAFELVYALEANGRDVNDLRAVLARADEAKFSGGGVAARLDAEERQRIARAVKEACR